MKNLQETKASLKKLLIKGIPSVLSELKGLLPSDSSKANDVLLLEGRLNDENKKLLRGTISNEELQLAYNQIRSDLMDLIDSIEEKDFIVEGGAKKDKKGAQRGELLYRIPDEMQLQKETKCIVRIALNDEEIIKNIELDKHVVLKELSRVSKLMQVSLIDPNENTPFAIRTVSEPEQMIFDDRYSEWIFFVKPLKKGKFPLMIKVAVIELVFEKERKREIIFEEKISVSTQAASNDGLKNPFKKSKESFILGGEEEVQIIQSQKVINLSDIVSPSKKATDKFKDFTDDIGLTIRNIIDPVRDRIELETIKTPSKETIKKMQTILKKEGFYKGKITGKLDTATLKAISLYQKGNALALVSTLDDVLRKMGLMK